MTPPTGRQRVQGGQVSLLIIGFAVVLVMMVGVVVDASSAYLRRQGLDSLADGAALAAADGVQGEQVYTSGIAEHALVDATSARRYVSAYLSAVGARRRYPGLVYSVDVAGDTVEVRVAAPLRLPITPPGWVRRPVISARSASLVVVSP